MGRGKHIRAWSLWSRVTVFHFTHRLKSTPPSSWYQATGPSKSLTLLTALCFPASIHPTVSHQTGTETATAACPCSLSRVWRKPACHAFVVLVSSRSPQRMFCICCPSLLKRYDKIWPFGRGSYYVSEASKAAVAHYFPAFCGIHAEALALPWIWVNDCLSMLAVLVVLSIAPDTQSPSLTSRLRFSLASRTVPVDRKAPFTCFSFTTCHCRPQQLSRPVGPHAESSNASREPLTGSTADLAFDL